MIKTTALFLCVLMLAALSGCRAAESDGAPIEMTDEMIGQSAGNPEENQRGGGI